MPVAAGEISTNPKFDGVGEEACDQVGQVINIVFGHGVK
jgi:hypothetical protein